MEVLLLGPTQSLYCWLALPGLRRDPLTWAPQASVVTHKETFSIIVPRTLSYITIKRLCHSPI